MPLRIDVPGRYHRTFVRRPPALVVGYRTPPDRAYPLPLRQLAT